MTTTPDRTATIGGSDVAAVLGLSPWRTPLDVWREKVLRQSDSVDTPATRAGTRFEPVIRAAYARLLPAGSTVEQPEPIVSGPWRYSPDGVATVQGWQRLVEIKTTATGADWGADGSEEVPMHYAVQGMWGMDLLGLEECDFPCVVWPRDMRDLLGLTPAEIVDACGVRVPRVRYSTPAAKSIRERMRVFWEAHVLPEVPPAPADLEDAKRLAYSIKGKAVELRDADLEHLLHRDRLKAEIKERQEELEQHELAIRAALGDAEIATRDGVHVVTCRATPRSGYVVAPTTYRSLTTTKHWKEIRK